MYDDAVFKVGMSVLIRNEYRAHPSLQGKFQGIIEQVNRIGTVTVYRVSLGGFTRTLTQGALLLE